MKKLSIVILALVMALGFGISVSWAAAYISGNAGVAILNDSDIDDGIDTGEFTFDTGYAVTGALGTIFANGTRGEIELAYRSNDLDEIEIDGLGSASLSGDVTSISLMANGYYDFITEGTFSPFIGGGVGFANIEGDIDNFDSEDDTVFAYQLALGGSFAASEDLTVDLQYRFFGTSDPEFDGLDAEYNSHNVLIGLRHKF